MKKQKKTVEATRSRRWRAGSRRNKKFKNVGTFRSDLNQIGKITFDIRTSYEAALFRGLFGKRKGNRNKLRGIGFYNYNLPSS